MERRGERVNDQRQVVKEQVGFKAQLWFHIDVTQWLCCRFDAVVNLFWLCVLVRGPITALDARLQFLGGTRQALVVDARRVRKDVMGHPPCVASTWNHN